MKFISTACVAALTAILSASTAFAAAPQFAAGTYAMNAYIVSNTVSGGGTCAPPAGTFFSGALIYPGPHKHGASGFIPQMLGATANYAEKISFTPKTPAALASSWTGDAGITFSPSAGFSGTIPVTFTINFRYFDVASFEATLTVVIPNSGGGTCTQVDQAVFTASS